MPRIVVIDSNIWPAEQMLRHSSGSAVGVFLRTSGARVAVPEVVHREVVRHLVVELQNLSRDIQQSHRRLLRHVGALKDRVWREGIAAKVIWDLVKAAATTSIGRRRSSPRGLSRQVEDDGDRLLGAATLV